MSGIEIISQVRSGLPLVKASTYGTAKDVPYSRDLDSRTYTGTYGAVYKTFDPSGRAYAVKEVSTEQRSRRRESHSIEEQIVSEITMLGQCNHKNVLRLVEAYAVETIKDTFYLVTEPWAPTTLRNFLMKLSRDGTTSPYPWWIADERHDIVLQICLGFIDGLSYLHDHRIKHKDIKPENLLLHYPFYESGQTPRVLPVIADFGISKFYRRGAQTMFTGATVEYLAPEQINHVESGLRADIFSMGCCFLLLFAAVCEGRNGVERIEDLVIDAPGSCQYGREIKRILPVLYEMIRTIHQSEEEARAKLTRLGLAVRDMLIEAPATRLSARSTRHALVEGEGLLPARNLFLDQESRCCEGPSKITLSYGMERQDLDQKRPAAAPHSTYTTTRSDEQDRGSLVYGGHQSQAISPSAPYGISSTTSQPRPMPDLRPTSTLPAPSSLFPRDTNSTITTPADTDPQGTNYNLVLARHQSNDQHMYTRAEVERLVARQLKDAGKSHVSRGEFESSVHRALEKLNLGPQELPHRRDLIQEPHESIPRSQQRVQRTNEYRAQTLPPSRTSSSQANTYPINDSYANADQLPRRHGANNGPPNSRHETSTDTDYSRHNRR